MVRSGLQPVLRQGAERLGLFHQHSLARERILRPEDPAVAVVSAHHPLVWMFCARHDGDDVIERLLVPVRLHHQVRRNAGSAHVIGDRQRAAPTLGRDRSFQGVQEVQGVAIADRDHRDLQDRLGLADGDARRAFHGPDPRRERIAGLHRDVLHGAALDPAIRTERALRIGVARSIAVVGRVRINDAAHRAVLIGELGLEPSPANPVPGDHDLALHIQPQALKGFIVRWHAVVQVDQRSRHIAVRAIGHIARQTAGLVRRRRIACDWRLVEIGPVGVGARQFEQLGLRRRIEHAEGLDVRVPTPRLELGQGEFRIGLVVRGSDLVGLRRHGAQPLADGLRGKAGIEAPFKGPFGLGVGGGKPQKGRGLGEGRRPDERKSRGGAEEAGRERGHDGYPDLMDFNPLRSQHSRLLGSAG